jgi:hypothetical protein
VAEVRPTSITYVGACPSPAQLKLAGAVRSPPNTPTMVRTARSAPTRPTIIAPVAAGLAQPRRPIIQFGYVGGGDIVTNSLSCHPSGLTCQESKNGKMPGAARGLPRMPVAYMTNITLTTEFVLPPRGVVTTANGVIRTMTTGGGRRRRLARAVDARRPPMRSLSRDRSRLVLWLPAVKGRIIKSWFDHGGAGRPGPVCWRASSTAVRELWSAVARSAR